MSPKAGAHGEALRHDGDQGRDRRQGRKRDAQYRSRAAVGAWHQSGDGGAARLFGSRRSGARRWNASTPRLSRSALAPDVAAIMLTNPNTCGLFESDIVEIAAAVHEAGGYFYCDGANFNAIMGDARPGDLGVDAMHINLHKTFSTPHGGGGPGAGPVVLSARLAPFAPVPFLRRDGDALASRRSTQRGHAELRPPDRLPRPDGHVRARARLYACRMAPTGLRQASEDAVLSANYVRASLRDLMSQPFGDRICMHEVLFDDAWLHGHRRDDARFRQGDDRRRLSSDDDLFPARRAWRHADRADGIGIESLARSLHRDAARSRAERQSRRGRALWPRAAIGAASARR